MTDEEINQIESELNYENHGGDADLGLMLIAALRAERKASERLAEAYAMDTNVNYDETLKWAREEA